MPLTDIRRVLAVLTFLFFFLVSFASICEAVDYEADRPSDVPINGMKPSSPFYNQGQTLKSGMKYITKIKRKRRFSRIWKKEKFKMCWEQVKRLNKNGRIYYNDVDRDIAGFHWYDSLLGGMIRFYKADDLSQSPGTSAFQGNDILAAAKLIHEGAHATVDKDATLTLEKNYDKCKDKYRWDEHMAYGFEIQFLGLCYECTIDDLLKSWRLVDSLLTELEELLDKYKKPWPEDKKEREKLEKELKKKLDKLKKKIEKELDKMDMACTDIDKIQKRVETLLTNLAQRWSKARASVGKYENEHEGYVDSLMLAFGDRTNTNRGWLLAQIGWSEMSEI
jgi:hypothetical protein